MKFHSLCLMLVCLTGCVHEAGVVGKPTQRDRDLLIAGLNFEIDQSRSAKIIEYKTAEKPGTIIVDTREKKLYLVQAEGKAIRYPVAVGKEGYSWTGTTTIQMKKEWPNWTPPAEMRRRWPSLPSHMEGGADNPLGARALYLYRGGGDTLYRIHGTNDPYGIGDSVSSGCIRLHNEQIIDLYARVNVGTKVIVR